jgi:hypothetical protein
VFDFLGLFKIVFSRPLKSPFHLALFSIGSPSTFSASEKNFDGLEKDGQKMLPLVQHSLEVESGSSQEHIGFVSKDSFVKVSAQSMICFQVSDDRFYGGPAAKIFSEFSLFIFT